MTLLADTPCEACGRDASALTQQQLDDCLKQLPGWDIVYAHGARWLEKIYGLKSYPKALELVQQTGALAEAENHHPEIVLAWGKVTVRWWTHTVHDIHINDCILAARCDQVFAELTRS